MVFRPGQLAKRPRGIPRPSRDEFPRARSVHPLSRPVCRIQKQRPTMPVVNMSSETNGVLRRMVLSLLRQRNNPTPLSPAGLTGRVNVSAEGPVVTVGRESMLSSPTTCARSQPWLTKRVSLACFTAPLGSPRPPLFPYCAISPSSPLETPHPASLPLHLHQVPANAIGRVQHAPCNYRFA